MNLFLHIGLYVVGFYLLICLVYYFIQEGLIFVPHHISDRKKYKFSSKYVERFFETPNNGKIHSLLFQSEESKGLILYLHGNTGSLNRWGYMAEELSSFHYDVLAIDFRGYGKSKGHRKESWMHEDVKSVFEEIKEEYKDQKLVVYGRSLGTGFAVRLASLQNIDLLVLECPFYSLLHVGQNYFPFLPLRQLLRYKFYNNIYLASVRCKIQIFHGTKDRIVPYKSAFKLFTKYEEELDIELTTIVGGKHNNLNSYALFREKLTEIL